MPIGPPPSPAVIDPHPRRGVVGGAGRVVLSILLAVLAVAMVAAACGSEPGRRDATGGEPAPVLATTTTVDPRDEPLGPGPATVWVLGDSVILGAKTQVPAALAGWKVTFDAKESRRIQAGISLLRARTGPPPRVVVVHLCTNWAESDYAAQIDKAMAALEGVDRVVWVTCEPWRKEVAAADADIEAAADRYPNLVVADWAAISETTGYVYRDHLHLKTPGAVALAALGGLQDRPRTRVLTASLGSAVSRRGRAGARGRDRGRRGDGPAGRGRRVGRAPGRPPPAPRPGARARCWPGARPPRPGTRPRGRGEPVWRATRTASSCSTLTRPALTLTRMGRPSTST